MRTPDEIRAIEFTKTAMGGYKQAEVDEFIDEIARQIENMALKMKDYDMKNRELESKLSDTSVSHASIQNVLIAAQKVADEVERDAKEKAAAILREAEEKKAEIDAKCEQALKIAKERIEADKREADEQTEKLLSDTAKKVDGMTKAARDSVEREQLLFDKLKVEMQEFRKQLTAQFVEQAEMLKKLPYEVPLDPERAAKAVTFEYDKEPDVRAFIAEENNAEKFIESISTEDEKEETEVLRTYGFDDEEPVMKSFDDLDF